MNRENGMGEGLLRQSLLNWYEFHKDASLLEINPGDGVLTELFCRRCGDVTAVAEGDTQAKVLAGNLGPRDNFRVVKGSSWEALRDFVGKFDYVVAVGVLEYAKDPAETLGRWRKLLKPEGTLLLTVENRYGLKYFCGARDPHTGLPYDGINRYLHGSGGKGSCLSHKELRNVVEKSGGGKYKFYYPVPDSAMPQMIFTDQYMRGVNAGERLVDYHYGDPAMVGVEHRIFCEMIDQGALPFLANSFLVEITGKGSLSDIIYAVTTTDRGAVYGAATTIREAGVVKKRALWPEGEENLRKLCKYTEDLKKRGIPVVETELKEDSSGLALCMPYIDQEGLSPVMERLAKDDPERFVEIFDEIYRYILSASDLVPDEAHPGRRLLKKGYLDLAPCNCFYIEEKDGLLFYDQEFVMENCPAEFPMFRTLKYCYASARSMEQRVPLTSMYQRYGMDESMVAEFEEREAAFIRGIRGLDAYADIFRMATPDYEAIYRRMKKMAELAGANEGKPYQIGYVPGVFDLFHTGHLRLLERCKARCEYLIVGVLTDELVEYYKGRGTVIPYEDRARIIEALGVVDEVIPVDFSNTDKLDAWEQLHYDCHFSGDDHIGHWNDVWEELKKRGSNMEFFSYTEGISTTQIREKMKKE